VKRRRRRRRRGRSAGVFDEAGTETMRKDTPCPMPHKKLVAR